MKDQLNEISKTLSRTIIEIINSVEPDQAPDLVEPLIDAVQKLSYLAGTVDGDSDGSE